MHSVVPDLLDCLCLTASNVELQQAAAKALFVRRRAPRARC